MGGIKQRTAADAHASACRLVENDTLERTAAVSRPVPVDSPIGEPVYTFRCVFSVRLCVFPPFPSSSNDDNFRGFF